MEGHQQILLMLKDKVNRLAHIHKKTVSTLKSQLQDERERNKKIQAEAEEKASSLQKQLEEEITKNAKMSTESNIQITVLKRQLEEEISKSARNPHPSLESHNRPIDINSFRDGLYSEAQITSLRQELSQEISKYTKALQEAQQKNAELKAQLEEEMEKNIRLVTESKNLQEKSQEEDQKKSQIIAKQSEKLRQLQESVQEWEKKHQALQKTELKRYDQLKEKYESNSANLEQIQAEFSVLKKNLQEMKGQTRAFDIVAMTDEVERIKLAVKETLDKEQQQDLKKALEIVQKKSDEIKEMETKVQECLFNLHINLYEMGEILKNHIYTEYPDPFGAAGAANINT